jgi:hypothetical protein
VLVTPRQGHSSHSRSSQGKIHGPWGSCPVGPARPGSGGAPCLFCGRSGSCRSQFRSCRPGACRYRVNYFLAAIRLPSGRRTGLLGWIPHWG